MTTYVDATAVVEPGAELGDDVVIWQYSKVRSGARVGAETKIGGGVYVGADVSVGRRCKIENGAQVFEGAALAAGVFVGPGVILTNDRIPRAVTPDGVLKTADHWEVTGVTVDEGASLGAGVIVVAGVRVGRWAMVGAGAVVTTDVPDHALVLGVPGRRIGWVCRCGHRLPASGTCPACGRRYDVAPDGIRELP